HVPTRILVNLIEAFAGRLQASLAALGLQDSVVKPPHFVDCRLLSRANSLIGNVGADSRKLDAEPDLVLLRQGLRDARVENARRLQRARQLRRLAGNWSGARIDAERTLR